MKDVCYLCGLPIMEGQVRSDDHVVPVTLITRAQPKVKGFDYGGYLPTHEPCNNKFGDETYVTKALDLLSVLHAPDMNQPLKHRMHENISLRPLDASRLPLFTRRDLHFFKLIDGRQIDLPTMSNPDFYSKRTKTNPTRDALRVCLSVLTKSAAALLVKRHLDSIPPLWRIYAQAYTGDLTTLDFSELLGTHKPFDSDVKLWVAQLPSNNWHVIYSAKDTLLFFTFVFHDRTNALREIFAAHPDAETWKFLGVSLNELLISSWQKV